MPLDSEMSALIERLLSYKDVVIIGGAGYDRFVNNLLSKMSQSPKTLSHLYIFPNSGSAFYRFQDGEWVQVYAETLADSEKKEILDAFGKVLSGPAYQRPEKVYGGLIVDRDTQISFTGVGLDAPGHAKDSWDRDRTKRAAIKAELEKHLPNYEVRIAGSSSIDVTKKGVDKAYGIGKISQHMGRGVEEMLFLGDALYDGGNDAPVRSTGIDYIEVSGPNDAKEHIRDMLRSFEVGSTEI